jgi:hypothetical protein
MQCLRTPCLQSALTVVSLLTLTSPRSLVLAMGNEARFGSLDKGYSEL